mgnify:FL=1
MAVYTTINDSSVHFQTKNYTGNGSTDHSITNDGNSNIRPDWLWIKDKSATSDHCLQDTSRGITKALTSNDNGAEDNNSEDVKSTAADGFVVGNNARVNTNSNNYVAWNWLGGGTAPSVTYKVVVVSDSGNKYRFRNSADSATFAASAVTLDLQEGGTYTFDQSDSSNSGHPFRFSTTSDGTHGGGSAYTTNVTTNGTPGQAGAYTRITVAASAPTLYYYCQVQSGMGGQANTNSDFGSTNFDGSILSIVQTNSVAGFSIVRWTGTGSTATVGHGLNGDVRTIIAKNRTNTGGAADWPVYHGDLGGTKYMKLNTTAAEIASSGLWNNTNPTSTVFTINTSHQINASGGSLVAYVFKEVEGFSRFRSYRGNNNVNGTFVHLGFKPSWVMIKRTNSTGEWHVFNHELKNSQSQTVGFNQENKVIFPNGNNAMASYTGTDPMIDILSNGFKIRSTYGQVNASNSYFRFWAFAKNPLVGTNNIVSTAV